MKKAATAFRKGILLFFFNIFVVLVALMLCEGFSSVVLFYQKVSRTRSLAERFHTGYDPDLGWVSLPNVYIEDMYGQGVYLSTNAQAFRNDEDFSLEVPAGKTRIICSGDSFTLGYGVDNQHTWCQLLARADDRLQTVNMGQGGYGVDQAYLWYKRDGVQLEHDIHLFTFISPDFERMERDNFRGYGKPLLKARNDELYVDNVPVPRRAFYVPWITRNQDAIDGLKSVQLLRQTFFENSEASGSNEIEADDEETIPELVAAKILEDLQRLNDSKASILVLVYLPEKRDYKPRDVTERWREYLTIASQRTGVLVIDLVEDFRELPANEIEAMFIPEGALDFPDADGHYTAQGNEFVARLLYEKLLALPAVAERLAENEQAASSR